MGGFANKGMIGFSETGEGGEQLGERTPDLHGFSGSRGNKPTKW